jgi:phosphate transport system permease protein
MTILVTGPQGVRAQGRGWVWGGAVAVTLCLALVLGLLLLLLTQAAPQFWPRTVYSIEQTQMPDEQIWAQLWRSEAEGNSARWLVKTGRREAGQDFLYLPEPQAESLSQPSQVAVWERREWGDLIGRLVAVYRDGERMAQGAPAWPWMLEMLRSAERQQAAIQVLKERRIPRLASSTGAESTAEFLAAEAELRRLQADLDEDQLLIEVSDGTTIVLPAADVVRAYRPNAMAWWRKTIWMLGSIGRFLTEGPREANTEGGVFPAIVGTVLLVFLMTIFVAPLGVLAAIYLQEYAQNVWWVRLLRITVHNLAGVPSIVYGVFGLGFFVYGLGGWLDQRLFAESLPNPTFGTGGLLWAALTMALLTLPVVIVATEEGLTRISPSLRQASFALGATQAETLWKVVLPMVRPAMLTGLILAIARAAGEVAPLMLLGVVKLTPELPLDTAVPFIHLERKFMHLGFHLYDVGFQSPNVEAARPLVYAVALLLVLIVIALNLFAVRLRHQLRERYRHLEETPG